MTSPLIQHSFRQWPIAAIRGVGFIDNRQLGDVFLPALLAPEPRQQGQDHRVARQAVTLLQLPTRDQRHRPAAAHDPDNLLRLQVTQGQQLGIVIRHPLSIPHRENRTRREHAAVMESA